MPLHLHRFIGTLAAGDQFSYGWHASGIRDIDLAHNAAILWNAALWNGATAGNGYKDHVTAGTAMTSVITVEKNPATNTQSFRRETTQLIPGVAAGSAAGADTALCVSLRTEFATRAGRGRFYLPQPAVSNITATGRVAADLVGDIMASLNAAWAAYNTATDRPVIYSAIFHTITEVTDFDIGDLFDTQRRRENKVTEVRQRLPMP